jgi:pyridinium-3,5-biscarboxylic acid mononucleotide sulfurtransferase
MGEKKIVEKMKLLQKQLRQYGRVLIAFSGGKDSFFLLQTAVSTLGEANVFPYFVRTSFVSSGGRQRVARLKEILGVPVRHITLDYLKDRNLARNPRQRCYLCKLKMFRALRREAKRLGVPWIMDGSTVSDLDEYRPGRKALEKLEIVSPLQDAGIRSEEIVARLRVDGVPEPLLVPSTCLATRFPYGHRLRPDELTRLSMIENFLSARGIYPLRARFIPDGVRIETTEKNFPLILSSRTPLLKYCGKLKMKFVTLDIGGLKRGAWD